MGEQYPPCRSPLAEMKKMFLGPLELGQHHLGYFVVARIIDQFEYSSSRTATLEDENGTTETLSINNATNGLWSAATLPRGSVVAIKDPYFKQVEADEYVVRIDHPSDMVLLEQDHALYPTAWKARDDLEKTAETWKSEGDVALAKESYVEAHRCYTRGLAKLGSHHNLLPQFVDLKRDLFRQRSLANLCLGRNDATISDAVSSLSNKQDEKSKTLNANAFYYRGRAHYRLEKYADALEDFKRVIRLRPSHEIGLEELQKTEMRLKEKNEGIFDFVKIAESARESKFSMDHASHVNKTEVRQTADRGRGLFAAQDISMGDLILCEKAFTVAVETNASVPTIQDDGSINIAGAQPLMCALGVRKVFDNPSLGEKFFNLYAGHSFPDQTQIPVIDGQAAVDVFRIKQILECNAFVYAIGRELEPYGTSAMMVKDDVVSIGVWVRASYANHSCLFNAARSFIGDLIIFRATKDIPKDAEITVAYMNPEFGVDQRREELENWGFTCNCVLCETEDAADDNHMALSEEAMRFVEAHSHSEEDFELSSDLIERAEDLAANLENAYSLNLARHLPCLAMSHLWSWLCRSYSMCDNQGQVKRSALKVLRSHGYRVEVKGSQVAFDASNGLPFTPAVDALVDLAKAYHQGKERAASEELERLGKKLYQVINGTQLGFR